MIDSYFWIGNGKTVLPDKICEEGSVLIKNGKIIAVNESCPQDVTKVDADGGYILPGFIDLHVHGGGGADFMDGTTESINIITTTHAKHGTTGLLATSMTSANDVLEQMIDSYLIAEEKGTGGAELLGLHLEGPFLSATSKGAQPINKQRIPTREELEYFIKLAKGKIVRWDEAPELENTDIFAKVMKENGIIASIAHTSAIAEQAFKAFDMGFSHITHLYSATTTGQKINGLCYSGVNEATFLDERITVELIADGRHIPREHMLLTYMFKGADKITLVTDAMRAAGTSNTQSILGAKDSGVHVVIKDGVAQLPDFSSYAGSIGTMDNALRVAHLEYGIPLVDVVKMMTLTPAKILGRCSDKGSLAVGIDADIVIMNNLFEVKKVYVHGVEI